MNISRSLMVLMTTTALVAGCTALPASGPSSSDVMRINQAAAEVENGIQLVDLSTKEVELLGEAPAEMLAASLVNNTIKPAAVAGAGDVLLIRIWEANPDGLFSTSDTPAAPIEVSVSETGSIFIPYAGNIPARGQTPAQIRSAITAALQGKVIDPQIQVLIKKSNLNNVAITGGVARPGQYPVSLSGLSLLDAVALSGGSRTPGYETRVTLLRDGEAQNVLLSDVFKEASNNVELAAGDTLELTHEPRSFTAFGAVARRSQVKFQTEVVTLEQAIAQAGGLNDNLADSGGVFLFRHEEKERLIGAGKAPTANEDRIPTIYRLDLSQPEAFFIARKFEIRNHDILYVANAPAVEFRKFMTAIVAPTLGSANSIQDLQN